MPIVRAQQIQVSVHNTTGLEVDERMVRQTMRKDLHMGYRFAKPMPPTGNSVQNLVLRQQYALRMLALLQSGRRIINVDQSWLNQSSFVRRVWVPTDAPATITDK